MKDNATVVLDGKTDEIKIFIESELVGQYKSRYECATHFAATLLRVKELEASNSKLGDLFRLSMEQTKNRDKRIGQMKSELLEIINEDLPDWIRQKIRDSLSRA